MAQDVNIVGDNSGILEELSKIAAATTETKDSIGSIPPALDQMISIQAGFTTALTTGFAGLGTNLDAILTELTRIAANLQNIAAGGAGVTPQALGNPTDVGKRPDLVPVPTGETPGNTPPPPPSESLSSRMGDFFGGVPNNLGKVAGIAAGGVAFGVGALNRGMAASQASLPIRSLGYTAGGAPTAQMSFGQQMAANIFANPVASALGLTSLYSGFNDQMQSLLGFSFPSITAAQQLGVGPYAQALTQSFMSGNNLPYEAAVSNIQAAQQAGYSYTGAVDPITGQVTTTKDAYNKSLMGQFVSSENKIFQTTGGALNATNVTQMLDEMFRNFGQTFDKTTTSILGFNTAANASQKSLQDYTQEVTQAVTNLQQQGITGAGRATEATTAAQTYSSIPQLQSSDLQKIVSASGAFMLATQPGKYNQLDFIGMMTGNTAAMAGQDANQAPVEAAKAANSMVNTLMKGITQGTTAQRRQAAIQEYAMMTGTSAGDITNLINPNNMKTLQQQATLGTLEDQLSSRSGEKGTRGAKDFGQYMKDFNAAYGISSPAERKKESAILSKVQQGKETLGAGIAELKKLNLSGDKANTNPVLGTIIVEAAPGTKATVKKAGSSSGGSSASRKPHGSTTSSIPVTGPVPSGAIPANSSVNTF
jgi:hypothetical protein